MTKINLPKLIEHLDGEFKIILKETLNALGVDVKIDGDKLFRTFRDRVRWNFRYPAEVSDDCVETKDGT